jgi:hypothetical protein
MQAPTVGIKAPDLYTNQWRYLTPQEAVAERTQHLAYCLKDALLETDLLQIRYDMVTRMPEPQDSPALRAIVARWAVC